MCREARGAFYTAATISRHRRPLRDTQSRPRPLRAIRKSKSYCGRSFYCMNRNSKSSFYGIYIEPDGGRATFGFEEFIENIDEWFAEETQIFLAGQKEEHCAE